MAFAHDLQAFAEQAAEKQAYITTEEATKSALIVPFLRVLGYDDANPTEVIPEYIADGGHRKDRKVDYALCPVPADPPQPALIIECKACTHPLRDRHTSQLHRYFPFTPARFGILTNGVTYQFYTDVKAPNVMETDPFLEIDLFHLSDPAIRELEMFTKAHFQLDRAGARAEQLYYTRVVQQMFAAYYETPSEEFAKHFINQIDEKKNTQTVRTQFTPLVQQAFRQFVQDHLTARLLDRLAQHTRRAGAPPAPDAMPAQAPGIPDDTDPKIITTEEELNAWYIIKAILRERVAPERITMRDVQRHCSILLDDNRNKRICRLWFNNPKRKQLGLFDVDKNEQKVPLHSLDDLYQFTDQLIGGGGPARAEDVTDTAQRLLPAGAPSPRRGAGRRA